MSQTSPKARKRKTVTLRNELAEFSVIPVVMAVFLPIISDIHSAMWFDFWSEYMAVSATVSGVIAVIMILAVVGLTIKA